MLLDGGQLFMMQAAVQSIVVATLIPDGRRPGPVDRRRGRRSGGACVAATVVPAAPLRRPRSRRRGWSGGWPELLRAAGE